jgi:CRP-like cAMP-binding protein
MSPSTVLLVEKAQMLDTLHEQSALAERFLEHMLARNIRIEEDLVDQLFNSSEKRLARTLLLLARYGKQDKPIRMVPQISQETLAEMVGTTRSRVNFFLNKLEARLHRVRRRAADQNQQVPAERGPPRLMRRRGSGRGVNIAGNVQK